MSITIKEALQRASFLLQTAGLEQPRREAQILLTAIINQPLAWLYAHDQESLSVAEWERYQEWLTRRAQGEPFAYLVGEKEFMGLSFTVTPQVLIPRPETEFLVEVTVDLLREIKNPRILEVGVGSGAVAISLAVLLPEAQVTAVDYSAEALAVANSNATRHGVAKRIRLLQGDLYTPVRGESFDAVVSNPPYIPAAEIAQLQRDVKDFEPHLALDGGADGLDFYRRLTGELHTLSTIPKLLAFEVGDNQADAVTGLCQSAGYKNTRQILDLAGISRIIVGQLS